LGVGVGPSRNFYESAGASTACPRKLQADDDTRISLGKPVLNPDKEISVGDTMA
jgi:hypothetical protein